MADTTSGDPGRQAVGGRFTGTASRRLPLSEGGSTRQMACPFCTERIHHVDYKDFVRLRRYLGDHGGLEPRRQYGLCARHQQSLTIAVKRARAVGLVPVTRREPRH